MRLLAASLTALALATTASLNAADGLELSFQNGRVTVVATDVAVITILEEWAEVGDTQFVDADKLNRVPVRLEMIDVPEANALRVLLRDASGYVTAPRAIQAEGSSRFDRVLVMAPGTRRQASPSATDAPASPDPPRGLPPAQGASTVAVPGSGFDFDDDRLGSALDELRELLPQSPMVTPFTRSGQTQPGATLPPTAPRPGMLVETTDDQAPVFIRQPVRPQVGDPR